MNFGMVVGRGCCGLFNLSHVEHLKCWMHVVIDDGAPP